MLPADFPPCCHPDVGVAAAHPWDDGGAANIVVVGVALVAFRQLCA